VGRMGIEILSFTIKVGKANILLQDIEVGGWDITRIFNLHTSKARYELKVVVLLHLLRVSVKTTGGFINIPLAHIFIDKTAQLYKYCK
jgi:hypothetical protein